MQGAVHFRPAALPAEAKPARATAISAAMHVAVLLGVLGVFGRSPRIEPYKLPGTHDGIELLTYYNPGSSVHAPSAISPKKDAATKPTPVVHAALPAPQPVETQAGAEAGSQSSPLNGVGDGDLNIALQQYFPYPKPDLSALPHGTHGDVILDAVVDQDGKIAELTLVQGLGPAIDDVVIATVRQWSYIPATRNGVPVPSKQELHFHYDRG